MSRRAVVVIRPALFIISPQREPEETAPGECEQIRQRADAWEACAPEHLLGHHALEPREVELDGLRPHRPGASAWRIAWAAYARSGELMERHLRPDGDSRPIIVLDPRTGPGPGSEELDAAVRATA